MPCQRYRYIYVHARSPISVGPASPHLGVWTATMTRVADSVCYLCLHPSACLGAASARTSRGSATAHRTRHLHDRTAAAGR
eukprot:scaffold603_cov404-Prasinococcus_capsulatus_cf.AAC.28